MQVPRRCPGQCQELCRYPVQLSGVVQVPCRCPGQCQESCRCPVQCEQWCRYPAGALANVRSCADTLCSWQEWSRYPAGALSSGRSGAKIYLLSHRLGVSQHGSVGDFLLAPACPIKKVTPLEGFFYLTLGSEADEGVVKN